MERHLFKQLVAEALDALPDIFLDKLDNVEVVVEDWPSREVVLRAGVRSAADLLGLYHGVPQTKRTITMAWSCRIESASTNAP